MIINKELCKDHKYWALNDKSTAWNIELVSENVQINSITGSFISCQGSNSNKT